MGVTSVVGLQWGDEGKGKVLDVLSDGADLVVRYQGGHNAGHTVHAGGSRYALHLVPIGILRPVTRNLLGHGVVIDPAALLEEIRGLEERGIRVRGRLFVSERAHLVLPYHVALDRLAEARGGGRGGVGGVGGDDPIGTTGRGIGPCYADRAARTGIRVADLADPEGLRALVRRNVEEKNVLLVHRYGARGFDADALWRDLLPLAEAIRPMVVDGVALLHDALAQERRILVEGAQGTLLDVDLGSYPFVTSSHASACGIPAGLGIPPERAGECIGVMKAYLTRVGEGPFPTELPGPEGERLRRAGGEWGVTTGRPRRCGWLDLAAARFAVRVNGVRRIALTKLDVLRGLDPLCVGTGYEIRGERVTRFPADRASLREARPIYREFPGFEEDVSGVRRLSELPRNARRFVEWIAGSLGVELFLVSVGSERDQCIRAGVEPTRC